MTQNVPLQSRFHSLRILLLHSVEKLTSDFRNVESAHPVVFLVLICLENQVPIILFGDLNFLTLLSDELLP